MRRRNGKKAVGKAKDLKLEGKKKFEGKHSLVNDYPIKVMYKKSSKMLPSIFCPNISWESILQVKAEYTTASVASWGARSVTQVQLLFGMNSPCVTDGLTD